MSKFIAECELGFIHNSMVLFNKVE